MPNAIFPILYFQGAKAIRSMSNCVRMLIAGIILGISYSDLNLLSCVKKTKEMLPAVRQSLFLAWLEGSTKGMIFLICTLLCIMIWL